MPVVHGDPTLTQKNVDQIEMVQRQAACFVKKDYQRKLNVTKMLSELSWPTLESRRKFSRITMFYRSIYNDMAVNINHWSEQNFSMPVVHGDPTLRKTLIKLKWCKDRQLAL